MRKLEEALVRSILSGEEYQEYAAIDRRLAENSRAIPTQASLAADLDGIMADHARGIAPRLDRARGDATKDRREKEAAELPWVSATTARQMAADLNRMIWFNNRVRTALAQLAAKHAIAARGLALQQAVVDEVLARQDGELGKEMTRFALRLQKAGLKTAAIKDLSNSAVAALASALGGEHDVDLLDTLGVSPSRRDPFDNADYDAELAALEEKKAALRVEIAAIDAEISFELSPPVDPPAGLPPVEEWDYAAGPLPVEAWSAVQDFGEGYCLDYRQATPEEVDQVLSMPLPRAHDRTSLWASDAVFKLVSTPAIESMSGGMVRLILYFGAEDLGTRAERDLGNPSNLMKAWLLLLAGRTMPANQRDAMFGEGFFHGVVLPYHAGEPGAVCQVLWKGRS